MARIAVGSLRGALLLLGVVGCGGEEPKPGPSAVASIAASAPAPAKPTAPGVCDMPGENEHMCIEYATDELATEREAACAAGLKRNASCPENDRLGSCRLPDGSARFSYPPRTAEQAEKSCKEVKGKFAAGAAAPLPDPKATIRCDGKLDGGCEEETCYTEARAKQAEEECATYGGKVSRDEVCARDAVLATCDLDGLRTLVFKRGAIAQGQAERYCTDRRGRFALATGDAPASASASASASAGEPVDEPPEPKADVVIRSQ